MKNNRIPELRFSDFSEEWDEEKLKVLAQFNKGNGYSKSDLCQTGIPAILYGRMYTNYETVIEEVNTFVENADNAVISEGDEVIVPASGESAEDIARASVVKASGVVLGGDINIIKPSNKVISEFLALIISNGRCHKELSRRAQGKSIVHLRNPDIKEIQIIYPTLEEQRKIAGFIISLEMSIKKQKVEIENLKKIREGFLQKMFPKDGELVPQLRFPGFTDDWEQRKLGEIAGSTFGGGTPSTKVAEYWNGNIPWIQSSDLKIDLLSDVTPTKHITEDAILKSATKLIPGNSIAIVTRVGVGKLAYMPYAYATSQDFLALSDLKVMAWFGTYSIYNLMKMLLKILKI